MGGSRDIWAVIPARGGSKGLPRKNIIPLGGVPLIAWSIAAARGASKIARVIVSTDDVEIARVAESFGAEVPFLRPPELAGDASFIGTAIDYTVDRIVNEEGHAPLGLCILYPTHPFRPPSLVGEIAMGLEDYIYVGTVGRFSSSAFVSIRDGKVNPVAADRTGRALYYPSGAAYGNRWFTPGTRLMENVEAYQRVADALLAGGDIKSLRKKIIPIVDPRAEVDIDTAQDLALAERLVADADRERIRGYANRRPAVHQA